MNLERTLRGWRDLALLACLAFALATLPHHLLFSWWMVALALWPALVVAWLRAGAREGGRATPGSRGGTAAALLVAGAGVAWWLEGGLDSHTTLIGLLLPPIAFLATRRRGADVPLCLFLALCMTVTDRLLGHVSAPGMAGFALAAAGTLYLESRREQLTLRTHALAAPAPTPLRVLRPALAASSAGLLALALDHALAVWPSAGLVRAATSGEVGLGDAFDLSAMPPGTHLRQPDEVLLRARPVGADPVPPDLLLRSDFFDRAGFDHWTTSRFSVPRIDLARDWFGDPDEGAVRIRFDRLDALGGRLPAPGGLRALRGPETIEYDGARGWLREFRPRGRLAYQVHFDPPVPPPSARAGHAPALLNLPAELSRDAHFRALAAEFARGLTPRERTPLRVAAAIRDGLQARCSYELVQPRGGGEHPLREFLFTGRSGYCMHFAAAAAVLLRMNGVPCRIATGLAGGETDPRHPGGRLYRARHAHAWVELLIEDHGFVPFEVSPQRGTPLGPIDVEPETATAGWWRLRASGPLAIGVAVAVLLAAFALLHTARRRRRRGRPGTPPPTRSERAASAAVLDLLRALARAGVSIAPGESVREAVVAAGLPGAVRDAVVAALAAYDAARFGGRDWDGPARDAFARGRALLAEVGRTRQAA